MTELAIESNPDFVASSIELKRGGKSYSVETAAEFHKEYGEETEIYFIIGTDSFRELSTWKDVDELLKRCQFIVAPRPGWNGREGMERGCHFMKIPGFEISSADIRDRVRSGRSIKYLLPEVVEKYIIEYGLYK
jgi:nicotinate-nucleotide adenylyltransferase